MCAGAFVRLTRRVLSPAQGIDFDKAGGLMSGTLSRLDGLVRGRGTQGHMCHVIMFAVGLFLLTWWLFTRR